MFRQKLTDLLPHMRLKHKDTEISFRLDKAEEEAASLPAPPMETADAAPTPEEQDRFEQLANVSPRAAILELRVALEEALMRKVVEVAGEHRKGMSVLNATRLLCQTARKD